MSRDLVELDAHDSFRSSSITSTVGSPFSAKRKTPSLTRRTQRHPMIGGAAVVLIRGKGKNGKDDLVKLRSSNDDIATGTVLLLTLPCQEGVVRLSCVD